ncbi:MAG: hypothetical protein DBY45_04035 [Clostridiales bacterium]|nr:MAG: hypothetical protein DBY45_04035 [Clostridiales bacterium]
MRKKIAFVTPSLLPMPPVKGGAMETLVNHLLLCNEEGHEYDFTVYCVGGEVAQAAAKEYRHTRFCHLPGKAFCPRFDDLLVRGCRKLLHLELSPERAYGKRAAKALSEEAFDLVIVENQPEFLPLVRKAAPHTPVWLHLHNHPSNFSQKGLHGLSGCDGVLAVSDFIREETLGACSLRPEQVLAFKNCVDTGRFDAGRHSEERRKIRARFGVGEEDVVLMYSGRLSEGKGVGELMEAFLQEPDPTLKLLLVGSDWYGANGKTPFISYLQSLAEKAPDRVFQTGFVPFAEMPAYYAAADICVLPSLLEEAAPLTVLEALAAGKPLIGTDAGGIVENVSEDCAVIVKRDENFVPSLAAAIGMLKDDPELRCRMGEAGRKRMETRDVESYYERFRQILIEICGRSHAD